MKTTPLLACGLALTVMAGLPAQTPKPVSKGYVGKTLPELQGHPSSDSRWLSSAKAVSLKKLQGQVALVVLTSLA